MENSNDEIAFSKLAGWAALVSAAAWIAWAVLNSRSHGQLDSGQGVPGRIFKLGGVLTAAWNLLLVPAALALWRRMRHRSPDWVLLYTVTGIASLLFWAYGGAAHGITPSLETTYLLMAGVWWIGIGGVLRYERKVLGIFTILLGLITCVDGIFSILEPLPSAIYMIAAPKLPMALLWTVWVGLVLLGQGSKNAPRAIPSVSA